MEAGVVEYQLCPLKLNCDLCEYHKEMTSRLRPHSLEANQKKIKLGIPEAQITQFTPGLQYLNRHYWIKRVGSGRIRLGIDSFLWHIFSSVQNIVTPKLNTTLHSRQCFSWLQLEGGIIYPRTPIAGQIITVNPQLNANPRQDTHLYLNPEEDLWLVELAIAEQLSQDECHSKETYLKQTHEDLNRLNQIITTQDGQKTLALPRHALLCKSTFSKYLLSISDSMIYIC